MIIGNFAAGDAAHEEFNFVAREFAAVTFFSDDVLWSQKVIVFGVRKFGVNSPAGQNVYSFRAVQEFKIPLRIAL